MCLCLCLCLCLHSLASLWQLMRFHMFSMLQRLRKSQDKDKELSDDNILSWANERVQKAGRTSKMESFRVRRGKA